MPEEEEASGRQELNQRPRPFRCIDTSKGQVYVGLEALLIERTPAVSGVFFKIAFVEG